jgi:hypothetical protein
MAARALRTVFGQALRSGPRAQMARALTCGPVLNMGIAEIQKQAKASGPICSLG